MVDNIFYWNTNIPFSSNKKKLLKFIIENTEEIEDYPDTYNSPNETYVLIQESRTDKIHIIEPGTRLIAKDDEGHFYTERTDEHEGYY
jgi:hypothetical protein